MHIPSHYVTTFGSPDYLLGRTFTLAGDTYRCTTYDPHEGVAFRNMRTGARLWLTVEAVVSRLMAGHMFEE